MKSKFASLMPTVKCQMLPQNLLLLHTALTEINLLQSTIHRFTYERIHVNLCKWKALPVNLCSGISKWWILRLLIRINHNTLTTATKQRCWVIARSIIRCALSWRIDRPSGYPWKYVHGNTIMLFVWLRLSTPCVMNCMIDDINRLPNDLLHQADFPAFSGIF